MPFDELYALVLATKPDPAPKHRQRAKHSCRRKLDLAGSREPLQVELFRKKGT